MPEIHNKTLHSFSSEDPLFPAKNLLETKVTKKWKCKEAGERSCFVILKLDEPRVISKIDIGNEGSGFIEVFVGNSKQDPPQYKEILLATSFMTITEAKNGTRPNRVRFFPSDAPLVESVAKEKWDLVKILCTQPFNNRIQYGISFITLHTTEEIKNDDRSPVKSVTQAPNQVNSHEKRIKFGKFTMRSNSDSESEDANNSSPFSRWKKSKSETTDSTVSIKDQMKAKIEENRKRIRLLPDSSDEDKPKPKPKPNRNRTGLLYEDEDDEPNERLQKKMDKDREKNSTEKKSPKLKRDQTPTNSTPKHSKFNAFINDDAPSTSSSHQTPSSSSKSTSSRSSEKLDKKSPHKARESEKKSDRAPPKAVSYKPFHKLLEGVVLAFSGYVNPERGVLRQKALDMGAKYKSDWDNTCTHLICAFAKTPKYQQVKGNGKIVSKKWIEACFSEQKRLSWRRFALDREDRNEPESEEEIHNILLKKSPTKRKVSESGSDDDMVVVDKRVKNGDEKKPEEQKPVIIDEDQEAIEVDDKMEVKPSETITMTDVMDVSTDDELVMKSTGSEVDLTQVHSKIFKGKSFYLNSDLSATAVIKLKNQITTMMGKLTENASEADFVITEEAKRLPQDITGDILKSLWVHECYELEALIPTTRYKLKRLN